MNNFKAGDRVYFPRYSNNVYTLELFHSSSNILEIREIDSCWHPQFKSDGFPVNQVSRLPHIFHATKENKRLFEQIYGIEFEESVNVIRIGNFEFPKPESEPLKEGEVYYTPCLDGWELYEVYNWYSGMHNNEKLLEDGLVHKTQEAAEQHAKVLIAISQGKTSLEE